MDRCELCGRKQPLGGLMTLALHVGGHGYQATDLCRDRAACRRRIDRNERLVLMQSEIAASRRRNTPLESVP